VEIVSTGAINWDVNLFVDTLEPGGLELPVHRITRVPGGKAANVAVAAARLLGPGRAGILGAVGDDQIGRSHREIFANEGVDLKGLHILKEEESGQAYILIDKRGRNQIFTHFGANSALRPELIDRPETVSLLDSAKVLIAMDPPLEYTASLFRKKRRDVTVVWCPGVRSLGHEREVLGLLGSVNYLVLNEQELASLTKKSDPSDAYATLTSYSKSLSLVATFGDRGCMLVREQGKNLIPGVHLEEVGLKVVNTVGCGDAFIGCFASGLVDGLDPVGALRRANMAGAFKATRAETRGSPTMKELISFSKLFE
jgi:ribokinase